MTQEEKELLLKDLCARLPYGVRCFHPYGVGELDSISIEDYGIDVTFKTSDDNYYNIESVKPYLRPRSSIASLISAKEFSMLSGVELIDWYNANHIDYRGLIEKGLAIAVTEENNAYKN